MSEERDETIASVAKTIRSHADDILRDPARLHFHMYAGLFAIKIVDAFYPRWVLMRARLFTAYRERNEARRERDNAKEEAFALSKSRVLDRLIIDRQRQQLIDAGHQRVELVKDRDKYMKGFGEVCEQLAEYTTAAKKAWKAENDLRSDFGTLAKDLRAIAAKLHPGEATPHTIYLVQQEITAWAATAEIAADAELYDHLTSTSDVGDFGPVPRPERPMPGCSHNSEEAP